MDTRITIRNNPMTLAKDIYFYAKGLGKTVGMYYENGLWLQKEMQEGSAISPEPSIHLPEELFQLLVDEILTGKYKPSEGKFTEGELVATKKHLEDMQKIVFKGK